MKTKRDKAWRMAQRRMLLWEPPKTFGGNSDNTWIMLMMLLFMPKMTRE